MYQYSTVYHSNTDHDYVSIIHKLNTLFFYLFFFSVNIFCLPIQLPSCFLPFSSLCVYLSVIFFGKKFYVILFIKKRNLFILQRLIEKVLQLIFIFFVGKDVSSRGSLVQWILDILDTIIRILDSKIFIDFENFYIRIVSYQNFEILISENGRYLFHQEMAYSILKNQNIILWYQKMIFFVFCLSLISENTSKILKRHPLHVYLPNLDK